MFTTFMVLLFIFTTTKGTFSKIFSSLSGKRLLYICSLYIINNYLNKKLKNNTFFMLSSYTFSNSNFFFDKFSSFLKFFFSIFFSKFLFENGKIMFETIFKFFKYFLNNYLYIY